MSLEDSLDMAKDFYVVGIGASAGGLRALEEFFENLPSDSGAAFVVVQHLSPDFKSLMKELLERRTQMMVHRVKHGMALEPNHVYLIPPRNNLTIRNRHLYLLEQESNPRSHPNFPINVFFHSLAKDCCDRAIGVVLSGTGSDGTDGLGSINSQGGLSLVQSPSTAEFDGMPQSAIATGLVDKVLSPQQLAQVIYDVVALGKSDLVKEKINEGGLSADQVKRVIALLNESENLDFSYYKISTLSRRIYRRASLAGYDDLQNYIDFLAKSREEKILLKDDLLIGVTRFFRDRDAWTHLERDHLGTRIHGTQDGDQFRVWVAGCASGEEAYSLAILIDHMMTRLHKQLSVKIFATDLDNEAIAKAAEGVYPENIAKDVPPEFLAKYFHFRNGSFHIIRRIREMIIFAPHNLTKNAGFTQMNLITCRNVLIYMRPQLQQQVLRTFHFSLMTKGILFLGESETPGAIADEFITLDKKWKIYQKRRDVRLPLMSMNPQAFNYSPPPAIKPAVRALPENRVQRLNNVLNIALQSLYRHRQATCVIVDENADLIHTVIDELDLMRIPKGELTQNVTAMLPSNLNIPINTAINRAQRSDELVTYTGISITIHKRELLVVLTVVHNQGATQRESSFTIAIEEMKESQLLDPNNHSLRDDTTQSQLDQDTSQRVLSLEYELQQTRENLQAAIEELETTNEEQQATNEELLASNEELQSTNEELHSVNEELYTVNTEYQDKITELTELSGDIDNLLRSTDIGVVFLDGELRIRKFTRAATIAINLLDSDIDRPLNHITHNLAYDDLTRPLLEVLKTNEPIELEIELRDRPETHLLMRVHPYATSLDSYDGVVLSFVDISELKNVQNSLADSNASLESLYANAPVGLALIDQNLRFLRINQELADINGCSIEEHLGKTCRDILPDLGEYAESILKQVIDTGEKILNLPLHGTTPARPGIERDWLANYYPVTFQNGERGVGMVVTEVSELMQAQQAVEASERRLQYLQNVSPGVIFTCRPTGIFQLNFVSQNIQELVGFPADYFVENPDLWLEHLFPQDQEIFGQVFTQEPPAQSIQQEYRFRCASGDYKWLAANLKLIRDEVGNPLEYVGFLMDVSDRKNSEEILRTQESLFRLTIDQSSIAVFTQDLDLRYTWVYNPMLFTVEEMLHKSDAELYTPAIANQLTDFKQQLLKTRQGDSLQIAITVDGIPRYFQLRMEPSTDTDDNLTGLAGVSYDITAEKEQQAQLAKQNITLTEVSKAAQAASIAKDAFLANMSHEIRTPMTAILGFTEILQEELQDHKNAAEYLQIIYSSADALLVILNDILDLSKIEAGQLRLQYEAMSLTQLFGDMQHLFITKSREKNIDFAMAVDESVPELIIFDEIRLRQILFNTISNALKFTDAGSVKVIASAQNIQQDSCDLKIEVSDTGIGIPLTDQAVIFDAFTQREGQSTKRYGGTGLGLNITSRLTTMLHGQISLQSEVGKGSTFSFLFVNVSLPVELIQAEHSNGKPEQRVDFFEQLNNLPPLKILCVDDNQTNRLLLKSIFRQTRHQLIEAEDGQQGIQMALVHHPDIILLDLLMPVLNGEKTLAAMEKIPQLKDIPVIILTAHTGDIVADIKPNVAGFLRKPFKRQSIVEVFKNIFAGSKDLEDAEV